MFCPTAKRTWKTALESCYANHQATNIHLLQLSYNSLFPILNSWSVTQLTFHFPQAIQHIFLRKFHIYPLEQDQHPKELKLHSPHVNKTSACIKQHQHNHLKALHTLNHTALSLPSSLKQIQEIHDPGLPQSGYSQSSHRKWDYQITRSKISYNLIESQPLRCTPNCGYQFHALAVHSPTHPSPKSTAPLGGSVFGIWRRSAVEFFCLNSQHVKSISCFRTGAPSVMPDGI